MKTTLQQPADTDGSLHLSINVFAENAHIRGQALSRGDGEQIVMLQLRSSGSLPGTEVTIHFTDAAHMARVAREMLRFAELVEVSEAARKSYVESAAVDPVGAS